MSRRGNGHVRCARCRLHTTLCLCALIPRVETRTRVVLFMHCFEDNKSTNTGRLAAECLPSSRIVLRGGRALPSPRFEAEAGTLPLLLFPKEGATPIMEYANSVQPVTLVVPDGTWRQASKARMRVPGLAELPCVSLPRGDRSSYRLRFEAHDHGLSTMEAIARALGVLEGAHVQQALENVFRVAVERILWSRGTIGRSEVSGGIPSGVRRDDPHARSALVHANPSLSVPPPEWSDGFEK